MLDRRAKAPAVATKVLYLSVERVQHEQRQRALPYPAPPMCLHPDLERTTVG